MSDLATLLGLQPHPEGGWFRETWVTEAAFRPEGYPGARAAAGAIYFLLPAGERTAWHRVRSDEVFLWHRGGPMEILLGGDGAAPIAQSGVVLGADVESGQRPQALVPGGVWQAARAPEAEVLVSCVLSPGYDDADFEAVAPKRWRSEARLEIERDADDLWHRVAPFGAIHTWHPLIRQCSLIGGDGSVGSVRRLVTTDGTIVEERLVQVDAAQRTFVYEFVNRPFPVDGYRATFRIRATGERRSVVEWSTEFSTGDERTRWDAFFSESVFLPGLEALRQDHG